MTREHAYLLRNTVNELATNLDDDKAYYVPELFPNWKPDTTYERFVRVRYQGELYRCERSLPNREKSPCGFSRLGRRMLIGSTIRSIIPQREIAFMSP